MSGCYVHKSGKKLDAPWEMRGVGVEMLRRLGSIKSLLYKFLVLFKFLVLEKRELEHISSQAEMFQNKQGWEEHIANIRESQMGLDQECLLHRQRPGWTDWSWFTASTGKGQPHTLFCFAIRSSRVFGGCCKGEKRQRDGSDNS